ncbi:MAG: hypothetical protein PHX65_08740 [Sulfurimonas sp.]|nr:hypothetical protein [Sulfurimonas sp.]
MSDIPQRAIEDNLNEYASDGHIPQTSNNSQNKRFNQDDLGEQLLKAKSAFIVFLLKLLESTWIKAWFRLFFYFTLGCFIWFTSVTMYDFLYHNPPNKVFMEVWSNSFDYIKTFFAAIGFVVILFKLFMNGKP